MKRGLIILAILAAIVAAVPVWFYLKIDSATFRYRLTYEVQTPQGLKSGSGVIQVKYEDTTALPLPNTGLGNTITGEAVVVDLGGGRYLFALIDKANEIIYRAFGNKIGENDTLIDLARTLNRERPTVSLPIDQAPMLVTFADVKDPKTVMQVVPANLAAALGPGFALKDITVEVTDEKVTVGAVEKLLAWLGPFPEPPLCQPVSVRDFSFCATSVHQGDIIRRGTR